ncbi:hypothetical protein [Massilia sp. 9096]|uniref:hypothetical protein n=1 Tax=Massilia sp. 9096 TaxID=1500894 RepID=UPI000569CA5D|nr:hypothetical protein [Massilia sp. 9096]
MNLLLAFMPFIVFVIVERLLSIPVGLAAGAVAAAALLMRDLITPGRSVKLLEVGTLLLFGGLTLLHLAMGEQWTIVDVRLRVDAGLLLIVLSTMVLGRPFSLQYARERAAPEHWERPDFLRVNYVISAAWALAFGVLVVADVVIDVMPGLPRAGGILAIVAALWTAAWFTGWYPEQHQRRMAGRT